MNFYICVNGILENDSWFVGLFGSIWRQIVENRRHNIYKIIYPPKKKMTLTQKYKEKRSIKKKNTMENGVKMVYHK